MEVNANPRRSLLDSELFQGIPEDGLKQLESCIRLAAYSDGQFVFRKGDPGRGMMMILSGRLKITTPVGNAEAILNVLGKGDILGEIALLDGGPRTADATAIEPTSLLVLDRRDFVPLANRYPAAYANIVQLLCRRIRYSTGMLEDSLFMDLRVRLGRALLRLAEHSGNPVEDGVRIELRLSQQDLARSVGMTRESINKQLRIWRERSWVRIEGRNIVLRDIEALRKETE